MHDADPVVLAVSGASAQPLAERALQLLLEADHRVEMVTSRGAIGVWQAELGLRVPSEPDAQEQFWRQRCGSHSGELRCHRWNDQAAAIVDHRATEASRGTSGQRWPVEAMITRGFG
ncbi:MAG: hypothetical protein WCH37_01495, partial [Synechococcaceae cyanobacterium ELA182]